MLLMRPRCTCSKLEQTKPTGGELKGAGVVEKTSIFDLRQLPRIQAPVTWPTAPVSRHATLQPSQGGVSARVVRCCGWNFQWEKWGCGGWAEGKQAGAAYHWVNYPFPCFLSWLHSKLAAGGTCEISADLKNEPLLLSVWNSIQQIVGPKFNDQPRLNCKLQIKIFLMEMKWTLKLKSGQAKGLFFDWSSIEAVQNQTKRVEKKSQKAFHLSFVCLAFTPCVL